MEKNIKILRNLDFYWDVKCRNCGEKLRHSHITFAKVAWCLDGKQTPFIPEKTPTH